MKQPVKRPGAAPRALAGRKLIKCPHCRELLMDLDKSEKVELFSIPARRARKHADYQKVRQCAVCGGKVGYNLISSAEP